MKNFIFDVDGTLIDTFNMYVPALKQALESHGYKTTESELSQSFGISGDDALRKIGILDDQLRRIIFDEWAQLSVKNIDRVTVYPGIESTLHKLKVLAQVKLVVVTSKTRRDYDEGFKTRYTIGSMFDEYVTADDTIKHKPDPEPILAGLDKVDATPEESMYIGDTIFDMTAAHEAGIKFGAALWGTTQKNQLNGADFLLTSPSDLLKLI
ncbi:HAD family hydrolase [Paucilactobacillus kaifaensis]|uniref:HAD family hydrolase n=1 Tax=Paucilactobacillus kaifaensis TaxID=2559921 RepID=UPI0010F9F96C|nr:HAD family hydrolase [Paucilactobacillus kaifaensis]